MYGDGKNWRYFIGLGLVIVLLFAVIFMIIRSGGDDGAKVPETKRELTSYSSDSNVTITQTTIGPVVASQEHHEIQISITNTMATIELMQGYDGNVINSRSYPVSSEAFSEFLSALEKAGYTKGDTDEELKNDEGYCATGQRYIFEVRDGAQALQRFWATSCRGTKTYDGDLNLTLNLFQAQIPDYDEITQDISFGSGFSGL